MATVDQYTSYPVRRATPQHSDSVNVSSRPAARVLGIPPAPCRSKFVWCEEPYDAYGERMESCLVLAKVPMVFLRLTAETRAALEANGWVFVDCEGGAK